MKLQPRTYQQAIYDSIMEKGNTLVVLPTGLGKTLIALMLIQERMKGGRALFLTPTKPLAKQHLTSVMEILELDESKATLVSGEVSPAKREAEYAKPVIVSTPQTIRNDMDAGRLSPDFSLIIFDECHRAVGDYAYTQIAAKTGSTTLHVGLTASPGGKRERIKEVLDALAITNIEIRTHTDPDVLPYVQKSDVKWVPVQLSPTLRAIKEELEKISGRYAQRLSAMGFPPPMKSKGQFMKLGERLRNMRHNIKYPAMVCYYSLMHVLHMSELLETQGVFPLKRYLEKMEGKEGKSAKAVLKEPGLARVRELCESGEEHPKLAKLVELVGRMKGKKMIVFAQYRDQIKKIEETLQKEGIRAKQFVGKKDGVTRKMQEETIAAFREGQFEVLVASSIGEEGLDIPAVDSVIFFEPIPSEIRSIQRRGRAARFRKGEIYILMTRDTRDEYYSYASTRKEERMKQILSGMKARMEGKPNPNPEPRQAKLAPRKRAAKGEKPDDKPATSSPATPAKLPAPRAVSQPAKKLVGQTKMSDFV